MLYMSMHMYCTHAVHVNAHVLYIGHAHCIYSTCTCVFSHTPKGVLQAAEWIVKQCEKPHCPHSDLQLYKCVYIHVHEQALFLCGGVLILPLPHCTATARDLHVQIHQFITHTTSNEYTPRSRHNAGYTFMYSCTCIYTQDTDVPVHVHACMCTCTVHVHVYGTSSLKSGERLFIHSGSFSM